MNKTYVDQIFGKLQNSKNRVKINKFAEFSYVLTAMIGCAMMSFKIYEAWYVYIISSILQIWWSHRKKYIYTLTLGIFFLIFNIVGTYNYLM